MYTVIFDDNEDCFYNWYLLDSDTGTILEWFDSEKRANDFIRGLNNE
jgi:hypothetical protein